MSVVSKLDDQWVLRLALRSLRDLKLSFLS